MDLSFNQIKSIGSNVFSFATNINLNSIRVRAFDSKWFDEEMAGADRRSGSISFQQNKVWCSCDWIPPALKLIDTLQSSNVTCRIRGSPGWKAQIDIANFACDFDGSGEDQTDDDSIDATTSTPQVNTVSTKQSTTPRVRIISDLEFDVEIDQSSIDSDNILDPKQSPIVIFDSQDVTSNIIMSSRSIFDDDFEESGDWIDSTDADLFQADLDLFNGAGDLFDSDLVDNDPFENDISDDFIADNSDAHTEEKSEMSDLEFESLIEMLELHFTNVEMTEIKVSTTPSYSDVELFSTAVVENPMKTPETKYDITSTSSEDSTFTTIGPTSVATETTAVGTTITTPETDTIISREASTPSLQSQVPLQGRPLFSFVQHHSRDDVNENESGVTTTSAKTITSMKTTMSPKQKRLLRQEKIREKAAQRRERDRQRAIDAKKKREARIQKEKVKRINAAIDKAERIWAAKQIAAIKKDVKLEKENQANAFSDFKVRIMIDIIGVTFKNVQTVNDPHSSSQ